MDPIIEAAHLRKEFGQITAVDDISFSVRAGEVLGFLGPNGAGKTTTMRMLTGYLRPTRGSVLIAGTDMLADPVRAKARIGYLPEGAPLYPEMTPASLLAFLSRVRGLKGAGLDKRLDEVAEMVHLREVWHQPIETLSKGFKRRLGLAQAILHDPEVLILDEPTDGLDPNQKREVRHLVRQMAETKAIIISTHILEEVHAVCSRAVIISSGRIVADGTPGELESRSRFHNAVAITVPAAEAAGLASRLEGMALVSSVATEPSTGDRAVVRAFPREGGLILQEVADLVRDSRLDVFELRQEPGRLDEVFRGLTDPQAQEGGAA